MTVLRALLLGLLTVIGSALLGSLILAIVLGGTGTVFSGDASLFVLEIALVVSLPCTAAGLVLIGLPIDWLLRKLDFDRLPAYAGLGTGGGLLFGLLLSIGDTLIVPGLYGLIGMLYGAITATVFWVTFRRGAAAREGAGAR